MNRGAIKAVMAKVRNVSVQKRRAVYRAEVVTNFRWEMTEDERAFSTAILGAMPDGCRFFHGGPAGFPVGSVLLPARETGKDPQGLAAAFPARLTHCYLTTSLVEAAIYAGRSATAEGGAIYRVAPLGALEVDPESIRTVRLMLSDRMMVATFGRAAIIEMETAFRCQSARVEAVEMVQPWAGTAAETRRAAADRVASERADDPQLLGPEGWAHGL